MGKSVAIEITDRELRALWFSGKAIPGRRSSLSITGFDRIPIPNGVIQQGQLQDSHRLGEVLKELKLKHSPAGRVKTYIGLPWQQGFVRVYQFPWLPEEKRRQAIRYFVEEEVPLPVGDLVYDALVLGEHTGVSLEILIGALRKSVLDSYVENLENAGYLVEGADLTVSILSKALAFRRGESVLYLHMENRILHIVFFHENRPEFARTLQCSASPSWLKECSHELERILLSLATQYPEFSLERILWSGEPFAYEVAENLLENLNQAVVIEEAFLALALPASIDLVEIRQYSPVAYALAGKMFSGDGGLNVWRKRQHFRRMRKMAVFTALPVAGILLLGGLYTYFLSNQERDLREELARLQPEGKRFEIRWQQEENLMTVWALLHKPPAPVGISLAQIDKIKVPGLVLQGIEYKQGALYLRGYARQAVAVEQLIQFLSQRDWKNPTLNTYQLREGNIIEFSISAGKSSPGNNQKI